MVIIIIENIKHITFSVTYHLPLLFRAENEPTGGSNESHACDWLPVVSAPASTPDSCAASESECGSTEVPDPPDMDEVTL